MLETQSQAALRYVVVTGKTEEEARAQYLLEHDAIHEDDVVWFVQFVGPEPRQNDVASRGHMQ